MRIDANSEPLDAGEIPPSRPAAIEPQSPRPAADLEASRKLARDLEAIPLVRSEKVEHAKTLVNDPSYPSDTVLDRISDLLAGRL